MTTYRIDVEIAASPARAAAVMIDVERWHEWTPSITSVTRLDGGPFGIGSRVRVVQPKLPPAIWKVVEIDGARGFTWISTAPGLRVTARHYAEPREGGSRATLSIEYAGLWGPLLARATRDINHLYLSMEAAGLKARCEGASL